MNAEKLLMLFTPLNYLIQKEDLFSKSYGITEPPRFGFDYVKGSFGVLTFSRKFLKTCILTSLVLEILFVHAHGKKIHLGFYSKSILLICEDEKRVSALLEHVASSSIPTTAVEANDMLDLGLFCKTLLLRMVFEILLLKERKYHPFPNLQTMIMQAGEKHPCSVIENIPQELNVGFGEMTNTFEAEIRLAEQAEVNSLCAKCDSIENAVEFEEISKMILSSSLPNALKSLGPYEEADEDLIKILNSDFRINQKQLGLISKLFTGAVINDKLALMSLTAETYSRHASLDIHLETGVDSVPCYITLLPLLLHFDKI